MIGLVGLVGVVGSSRSGFVEGGVEESSTFGVRKSVNFDQFWPESVGLSL